MRQIFKDEVFNDMLDKIQFSAPPSLGDRFIGSVSCESNMEKFLIIHLLKEDVGLKYEDLPSTQTLSSSSFF